jgi:hypothetical protein
LFTQDKYFVNQQTNTSAMKTLQQA